MLNTKIDGVGDKLFKVIVDESLAATAEEVQYMYCNRAVFSEGCKGFQCFKCIFDEHNIIAFRNHYKWNKKEEMLNEFAN